MLHTWGPKLQQQTLHKEFKIWNDEVIIPLVSCGGNSGLKEFLIQEEDALSNQHMDIVKFG